MVKDRMWLVEQWLEHCKKAKHVTQSDAGLAGKKRNPSKYAAYILMEYSIGCSLCDWREHMDKEAK